MKKRIGVFLLFLGLALFIGRFVVGFGFIIRWVYDSTPRPEFFGLGIDQYMGVFGLVFMLIGIMMVISAEK